MAIKYDPYENVVSVMEKAMEVGKIRKEMFEIIKNPQRETKVYLPVKILSILCEIVFFLIFVSFTFFL